LVRVVGSLLACLDGFIRRIGWNQAITACADQVLPPRFDQRLAEGEPVVGFEELHQRPLEFAVAHALGDRYRLLCERVEARGNPRPGGDGLLDFLWRAGNLDFEVGGAAAGRFFLHTHDGSRRLDTCDVDGTDY
jgi:hypothetical protein